MVAPTPTEWEADCIHSHIHMVKHTFKQEGAMCTGKHNHSFKHMQTHRHTHAHTLISTRILTHPQVMCVSRHKFSFVRIHTHTHTHEQGHWHAHIAHTHKHTLPLRHTAYIQGDFGCRATDGEATALFQPALSRSDSRLGCHRTLAVQGPLMPTALLPLILRLAPVPLTPP